MDEEFLKTRGAGDVGHEDGGVSSFQFLVLRGAEVAQGIRFGGRRWASRRWVVGTGGRAEGNPERCFLGPVCLLASCKGRLCDGR